VSEGVSDGAPGSPIRVSSPGPEVFDWLAPLCGHGSDPRRIPCVPWALRAGAGLQPVAGCAPRAWPAGSVCQGQGSEGGTEGST